MKLTVKELSDMITAARILKGTFKGCEAAVSGSSHLLAPHKVREKMTSELCPADGTIPAELHNFIRAIATLNRAVDKFEVATVTVA